MSSHRDTRIPSADWDLIHQYAQETVTSDTTAELRTIHDLFVRLSQCPESAAKQEATRFKDEVSRHLLEIASLKHTVQICNEKIDKIQQAHDSMETQLNISDAERDAATKRLDQILALDPSTNGGKSRFPDAPMFDSSKPSDLRTWQLQLMNKLNAEP